MPQPSTWSRTPRGIEIVTPRPGAMRRALTWLGLAALLLSLFAMLEAGDWRAPWWLARWLIDASFLALAVPLLVALLVFDRHSNVRVLFAQHELVTETRIGRFVVWRTQAPLSAIAQVDTEAGSGADGMVLLRRHHGGPWPQALAVGLDAGSATQLADTIRAWLLAPGSTTVAPEALHQELPLRVIEILRTRLVTALPLAIAGLGLLLLACVWTLRGEQVSPQPAYDASAVAELLRYRWVVREPNAEEREHNWTNGVAALQLGVRWQPPGGPPRELWWTSSEDVMLDMLAEYRIAQVGSLVGAPWIELSLPAVTRPLLTAADGEPSFANWPAQAPAGQEAAFALADGFDDPIDLLAALSMAAAEDWQVVYRQADPTQATLAPLARIERDSVQDMPLWLLLGAGLLACWPLFAGLGAVFPQRRLGLLIGIVALLALPWWAPHADRIGGVLGIDRTVSRSMRAMALAVSSPRANEAGYQLVPRAAPAPDPGEVVVRWTPQRSASAALLPLLGLDRPLAGAASVDAARRQLELQAEARIGALGDAELVAFIETWKAAEFGRYGPLRAVVIDGLCAAHGQPARSANTRRWIEHGISNLVLCEGAAGGDGTAGKP